MSPAVAFVLYLLALICFAASAFGADSKVRVNLVALGLALAALVWVLQAGQAAF